MQAVFFLFSAVFQLYDKEALLKLPLTETCLVLQMLMLKVCMRLLLISIISEFITEIINVTKKQVSLSGLDYPVDKRPMENPNKPKEVHN